MHPTHYIKCLNVNNFEELAYVTEGSFMNCLE
jgi:hypothetical protein